MNDVVLESKPVKHGSGIDSVKGLIPIFGIIFAPIIYNILSAPPDGFPAVGGSESFMLDFLLQEAYFDTSIQERIYYRPK